MQKRHKGLMLDVQAAKKHLRGWRFLRISLAISFIVCLHFALHALYMLATLAHQAFCPHWQDGASVIGLWVHREALRLTVALTSVPVCVCSCLSPPLQLLVPL
jgi:hypothetical protein